MAVTKVKITIGAGGFIVDSDERCIREADKPYVGLVKSQTSTVRARLPRGEYRCTVNEEGLITSLKGPLKIIGVDVPVDCLDDNCRKIWTPRGWDCI